MRTVLLIRHAESTGNRYDRHLFGSEGAPLSGLGQSQARELGQKLEEHGIDMYQRVATSELIRTQQTAQLAGFENRIVYSSLNEIRHGLDRETIENLIKQKKVTPAALNAARKILHNPPTEYLWFTHGMLIAAIGELLEIAKNELFIPDFASITKITLP